ncbi:MAG: CarD family transcriptional regulator [Cellulosilyticaceae bacterium]
MFKIGEHVFCPMRGSGVIEAIEERTMLSETREYVIIHMKFPDAIMMVPTDRIETSGFRTVQTEEDVEKVEKLLSEKKVEVGYDIDIKQRIKINQGKLSTGSFIDCGEVVRDLACMEQIKVLNNSERTLLMQAKRLLADELSIIKNMTDEDAKTKIETLLT